MPELNHKFEQLKACVLVSTYNNEGTLKSVINSIQDYTNHVIVVDDGSTDGTKCILQEFSNIVHVELPKNRGKGMALRTGIDKARELGFKHVISMDSDGQHRATDLPAFLDQIEKTPDCLLVGTRNMKGENVPGKSSFGNSFSSFWFWVNTGIKLPDTQSGFRSYPVELLADINWKTKRFEFEVEVLVRSAWKGICIRHLPINVYYPPVNERVSHFRTVGDFARISLLNTLFVAMALFYYWPRKFGRATKKMGPREVFKTYIYDSSERNVSITLSVLLGVFIGITPFWGYQILLIILLAHWFKLNKAIALVAGHISIPPMIPFILFGSYKIGGWLLGSTASFAFSNEITLEVVKANFLQYFIGAFALATICALVLGSLTYILLLLFRPKKPFKIEL